jgi:hypothetical protein
MEIEYDNENCNDDVINLQNVINDNNNINVIYIINAHAYTETIKQ